MNQDVYFRKLTTSDVLLFGRFLEKNNDPETCRLFSPFPMQNESSFVLRNAVGDDYFGAFDRENRMMAFSMLRGADEGYDIPSFGICVDKTTRGKGIGMALAAWTFRWADLRGIQQVRLSVYRENSVGIHVYRQLGFQVTEDNTDKQGRPRYIMHRGRQKRFRIAVSTSCLHHLKRSLDELLSLYYNFGLLHVECSSCNAKGKEAAVNAIEHVPLIYQLHNYFPPADDAPVLNLASPATAVRERSQGFYREAIDISAQFQMPCYAIHAGFCTDPRGRDAEGFIFPEVTMQDYEAAEERFICELETLSDYARSKSVRLLVENNVETGGNQGKVLCSNPSALQKLCSKVTDMGLLLDTGHAQVSDCRAYFDPQPYASLKQHILRLHLHSNDGKHDTHEPFRWSLSLLSKIKALEPEFCCLEGHYGSITGLQKAVLQLEQDWEQYEHTKT